MVICDVMTAHEAVPGYAELRYRSEGGIMDRDYLSSWKVRQVVTPGSYTLNSFNFESPNPSPNTKLLSKDDKDHAYPGGNLPVYQYSCDYLDLGEGERLAVIRREEAQAEARTVVANTNARGLTCGAVIIPLEVPRGDQSGLEFLVTATSFKASAGHYGTGTGTGEEGYECTFNAIPAQDCVFRAKRVARIPRMQGLQTAIVTGPPDEEIHVDKYGRVKVQFHWDLDGQYDDGTSCWIRVSQAWAGAGWGAMAIPRIGQEVLEDFVEGDPDQPIITGRVYNGDHPVPYDLPKEKTKTTFKSNSTPDGGKGHNEWRFEDKKGKEQIYMHAQKNMDVRIRNQLRQTNSGDRHDFVGWEGDKGKGGSQFTSVTCESNETIGEKLYYKVEQECHYTVTQDYLENHEANHMTWVKEDHVVNATNSLVEVGQKFSVKSAQILLQGRTVHLAADQIVLGASSICLKSGASFIAVNPGGVQIKGTAVLINSGGVATSASQPAATQKPEIHPPLDALPAVDSRGGGKKGYRGTPRTRGAPGPSFHNSAPEVVLPPETPPLPPLVEPDTGELPGPCIDYLKVKDKNDRFSNSGLILEVVTNPFSGNERITFIPQGDKECGCPGPSYVLGERAKVPIGTVAVVTFGEVLEGGSMLEKIRRDLNLRPKIEPFRVTCDKDDSTIATGEIRVYRGNTLKLE